MPCAFSKHGSLIIGTAETALARAEIREDSFSREPDGSLDFEHAGGSEVFWDTMETQADKRGRVLFLDADGDEYTPDEITLEGETFPALRFWADAGPEEHTDD